MEEAENLCDYIVIMDNGVILKEGHLNQLLEEETNEKIVEFTAEKLDNYRNISFLSNYLLLFTPEKQRRKDLLH